MDISIFFLLLMLIQTPLLSSSSKTFDVLRGLSLSVEDPSDKLVSLNGDFSAGFFPVGENAFCFAIWLTRSSAPTVVWMANRDDPVDGTGSQLSISEDGKLRLTNSTGITVRATRTAASTTLESWKLQLQLQNTGNLVLNHSQYGVVWQSFDSPTDTLLPQQMLTRTSTLVSKLSKVDYSSGYYKLFFDNDNVLRLLYQGPVVSSLYWPDPELSDPGLAGRSMYNSSRAAVLNELGYLWSSDHLVIQATDFGVKTHRRLTIDRDGNLRLYSLEAMNEGWIGLSHGKRCRIHARFMAYVDPIVFVVTIMLPAGDALACRDSRSKILLQHTSATSCYSQGPFTTSRLPSTDYTREEGPD